MKEYVRLIMLNLLDQQKKITFSQIENIIEEKKEYFDILKQYRKNFSYQLLDKFIEICEAPEEFKVLCEESNV